MRILLFAGGPFGLPLLERMAEAGHEIVLVTSPPKPRGRGLKPSASDIAAAALRCGVRVWEREDIRSDSFLEEARAVRCDILMVVDYGKILPAGLVRLVNRAVNVHPSLLPLYRGATPIQTALLNGERTTGVTLQALSERVDAGAVLLQEPVAVGDGDDYLSLSAKLQTVAARLVADYLADPDRYHPGRGQDESQATYCRKFGPRDHAADWTEDAWSFRNRLRALYPKGLRACFREGLVKVLKARVVRGCGCGGAEPGRIVLVERDRLHVATGWGAVALEELQPENRNRLTVRDFINGYRPLVGECFGSVT